MSTAMPGINLIRRFALVALLAAAMAGCGGGGGGTPAALAACNSSIRTDATPTHSTYTPNQSNAVELTVDNGPACSGYNANRLYTSVTICQSGSTTQCQTIDHVLVDTGSTGLRLLHSAINPAMNLGTATAASGRPLLNCIQFVDYSHAFGRVATADVTLGPKTATNLPIQIIADPAYTALSVSCAAGTGNNTPAILGANGILGVGLYRQDCGAYCDDPSHSANGYYFTCTSDNCSAVEGTAVALAQQVANPVTRFGSDNNGVVIDLPAVTASGTTSIAGQLLFGIGTQSNNTPSSFTTLNTTSKGYITTVLSGTTMGHSFIDTGSNGLYFGTSSTLRPCTQATGFYCPLVNTALTGNVSGTNPGTVTVPFVAGNAESLFQSSHSVLPTLTGPMGNSTSFDWGLPFFYGRRVFIGMEGTTTALGTGPLYAF